MIGCCAWVPTWTANRLLLFPYLAQIRRLILPQCCQRLSTRPYSSYSKDDANDAPELTALGQRIAMPSIATLHSSHSKDSSLRFGANISVFGADPSVDPTSMLSTRSYSSYSTDDADDAPESTARGQSIVMPSMATLHSSHSNDSSLRFGANISVFGTDPSVDPTSMLSTWPYSSNFTDNVGGLSSLKTLEQAFVLSMASLYNLPAIVLSYLKFRSC